MIFGIWLGLQCTGVHDDELYNIVRTLHAAARWSIQAVKNLSGGGLLDFELQSRGSPSTNGPLVPGGVFASQRLAKCFLAARQEKL